MKTDERIIQLRHFNRTGLADWECATLDNSAALIESQSAEIAVLRAALAKAKEEIQWSMSKWDSPAKSYKHLQFAIRTIESVAKKP